MHRDRCTRQRLPGGKLYQWEFARGRDEIAVDVLGMLTLDHNGTMVDAAIDRLGIAFVLERLAREALRDGRLHQLLEGWSPPIPRFCLYYPGRRHVPPALHVGAMQDFR